MPDPRLPAAPQSRALFSHLTLIGTAIAAALLLILLWPIAVTLRDAVATAIHAHGDLIAGTLLLIALLLFVGLIRIVFAFGRRLDAQADQAAIVRLENEHPIHIADVRHRRLHLVERSLELHYGVAQARAEHSQYPQLASIHQAIRIDGKEATPPATSPIPALPALLSFDTQHPLLAQLRDRGHVCRSGRSLLVGYDAGSQPLYIELAECGFIAVAGQPRVGKTTLVTLLLAQAALMGWHIALADPHIHKEDGLINRCMPISGHTIRQAVTPEEVAAMVRFVNKIGRARVNGDRDRTPVLMVIDEFSNFVIRGLLPNDVLAALPAMAMEYAGVGVHGLIIGHDWNARLLGVDLGAALRRAITHRLVCRSDAGNAEFLLPNAALARQAASLAKGQALYWGTEAPAVVTIPRLGAEDLTYAAQGVPPRLYAPRPTSRPPTPTSPTVPPTIPISPRPVPPTVRLPEPTIQEQIISLLATCGDWLTSTEIAQTLALDLKAVRTALTPLQRQQKIVRRATQRSVPETYEYACPSVSQSPSLTPTA